jgi:hypothetical protein
VRACTPQPTKPTVRGEPAARYFEAIAAAAPVRTAVTSVASITASGSAVAGSERM